MCRLAGLRGQYIQVRRSGSNELTYGGDQSFFKGAPPGSEDEKKHKLGCGITALSDMFLYLADRDPAYIIRENEGYVNHIFLQKEYEDYYNRIYELAGGLSRGARNGLGGLRLQRSFNRVARGRGWKIRAHWGMSLKKLYSRIEGMLGKDIPVILCIPLQLGRKRKEKGICFYRREKEGYRAACTVSGHYVTVTGITEERDARYLELSSWGSKYYVNWEEYDRFVHTTLFGAFLGNILYIR